MNIGNKIKLVFTKYDTANGFFNIVEERFHSAEKSLASRCKEFSVWAKKMTKLSGLV